MLGGVEIDHEPGLAGHSDADVVIHAVIDACSAPPGRGTSAPCSPTTRRAGATPTRSTCCARWSAGSAGGSSTSTPPSSASSRAVATTGPRWSGSSPRRPRPGSASRRRPTRAWAGSAAARESPALRSLRSRANSLRRPMGRLGSIAAQHAPIGLGCRLRGQGSARGRDPRPDPPRQAGEDRRRFRALGASPALGITAAAIHHPHETALIDERGSLTFEELDRRSNALAHAWRRMGIGLGDGVGIMCRNHRGFVDATSPPPSSAPARST